MTPEPQVVGRRDEITLFDALCDDLSGHGSTLILSGPPGIGKSYLLDEFARRASTRSMTVLRGGGSPAEASVPYAGLHLLLHPLRRRFPDLPPPQRAALEIAFGTRDGPTPGAFLAGMASLTLLAEASSTGALAVIVDDLHWLDPASRSALFVALRRLRSDPVVAVLATREDEIAERAVDAQHRVLSPLGFVDANTLLDRRKDRPLGSARRELLDRAQGNPLALVELSPSGPAGIASARRGHLTQRLQEAFRGRLDELSPPARLCLAVAAIAERGTRGDVLAAASVVLGRPIEEGCLDAAVDCGLLNGATEVVSFRHPLVPAAVASATPPAQRRAILRALLETAGEDRRSVWWQVELATGADDSLANRLDDLAGSSLATGDGEQALRALRSAAALTTPAAARADRLM
ncbi:AAA family ATPase, partial [Propionicimonas sp.]|uniref:AAA family ATPase n=1 Tax=Propionicimonas sp. TaxID=1955623 RepID=UPI0039E2C1D7